MLRIGGLGGGSVRLLFCTLSCGMGGHRDYLHGYGVWCGRKALLVSSALSRKKLILERDGAWR